MTARTPTRRPAADRGRWRHAAEVVLRTLVAVVGGYALAHAFSAVAASILPGPSGLDSSMVRPSQTR